MPNHKYLPELIQKLGRHGQLSLQEVSAQLSVSEATARRLLAAAETEGMVERFWGGVRLPFSISSVHERATTHLAEKKAIAATAADWVQDNETIILDGGSTTVQMVPHLSRKKIKVLTNSILIAQAFDQMRAHASGPEVLLTGGWLFQELGLLTGSETRETLRKYRADRLFMSVAGVADGFAWNHNPDVVETETTMLAQSQQAVLLIDPAKLNRVQLCRLCPLDRFDAILTLKQAEGHVQLAQVPGSKLHFV
jgi:DeoR/GlpR family transcriptional regulator of sugar metabolism